jgi:hypothetical protein
MDEFIVPEWPTPSSVKALVTTVAFGNLAGHVGDDPAVVAINRARLARQLPREPRWLSQVHGTRCVSAEIATAGIDADAITARSPGAVCAVLTADCLPILLCDNTGSVVAAAHAGWRGLAAGIIEATVAAMGGSAEDLLAWLGPAIGPEMYEVGTEVLAAFVERDPDARIAFSPRQNGRFNCDLFALARLRFARLGVHRVYGGGRCTFTDSKHFYSFRRGDVTGRMASLIWIV